MREHYVRVQREGALRRACYLMRQNCVVRFIDGPNDEESDPINHQRSDPGRSPLGCVVRSSSASPSWLIHRLPYLAGTWRRQSDLWLAEASKPRA